MQKPRELKHILAENLKAIKRIRKLTQAAIARKDMDQTTVGRIERAEIATTLDMVQKLAGSLELEAWQLLVPDMDPENLPVLRDPTKEDRDLWKTIQESARQKGLIER